jgi:tRNA threonylcarbamoyladenosine biosynthesis protein TsaE
VSELAEPVALLSDILSGRDIVFLSGPMGVGKTSFVKSFMESKGCSQAISPTFALHNEYQTESLVVDHLDLYRLESEEELENIGFWDLFAKPKGLILIEWPDRIPSGHLPKSWQQIEVDLSFDYNDPQARLISIRQVRPGL